MRNLISIIVLLFIGSVVRAHPLHVSVTNIVVKKDSLLVTIQTFKDDWETAYFHYNGQHHKLEVEDLFSSSWYRTYLTSSFRFSSMQNGIPWKIEIKNVDIVDQSMMIELRSKIINKPNSLCIYNGLLVDIFPDQTNLTIIGSEGEEHGIKFDVHKRDAVMKLKRE